MTYIGGIEALHSWTPPGASEPAVVLGEITDVKGLPLFPRFKLTRITGLTSLGESEDNRDKRVRSIGEIARLSKRRGRSIVYEGEIIANGLLQLREAESMLREAFADQTSEGRMDLAAHPDNKELAGQSAKFFEARALNVDIIDAQASKRYSRPFVVGLRTSDPRVFDEASETHTVEATTTNSKYTFS